MPTLREKKETRRAKKNGVRPLSRKKRRELEEEEKKRDALYDNVPKVEIKSKKIKRITAYNNDTVLELLSRIALGLDVQTACVLTGIKPSTYYSWYKSRPKFKEEADKALAIRENRYLSVICEAALIKGDWRAATWVLEKMFPKKYGPLKDQDKDASLERPLKSLSDDQLKRIIKRG